VIQAATRSVQSDLQLTQRQSVGRSVELRENLYNQLARWKGGLDEVIRDVAVATPTEQHRERIRQRAPGASHLLIIMHDRTWQLIVDDEGEVRLVEAHPECGGGDECFQLVAEQPRFKAFAKTRLSEFFIQPAPIWLGINSIFAQPGGHRARIADGQRVNHAAAGELGQRVREPGQPGDFAGKGNVLQLQTRARQLAALDGERRAELRFQIGHDAVVRRGGGGEHADIWRQRLQDARDAAVVGAEVVTPIGNAMRLIHHEQADARSNGLQHRLDKFLVTQPLWRNKQNIHAVGEQFITDAPPVFAVLLFRSDAHRPDARAFSGGNLIPHQGQQRRNDERRPGILFAKQFCGDEIDIALAPASALNNEQRAAAFQQMFNRFELSRAESCLRIANGLSEKFSGAVLKWRPHFCFAPSSQWLMAGSRMVMSRHARTHAEFQCHRRERPRHPMTHRR
jgi:hypothetical protein